jgi:hypothetical protein
MLEDQTFFEFFPQSEILNNSGSKKWDPFTVSLVRIRVEVRVS